MNITNKEKIDKGWSGDDKYCITSDTGEKFLLRISSLENEKRVREAFHYQELVAKAGILVSKPIEIGTNDKQIYTIEEWLEGDDARDVIANYSNQEQYDFGYTVGKYMLEIHKINAPSKIAQWDEKFNAKMDRKIQNYLSSGFEHPDAHYFIDYIEKNRHLLKGRNHTFQHGDYHIGNMMISNNEIFIIDFDKYDFGDPWEEFNRIVWSAQASDQFAKGMVDGYFNQEPPMTFWKLLSLYISSNSLSHIPWAIAYGKEEEVVMLKQVEDILTWFDNMQNPLPSWYLD